MWSVVLFLILILLVVFLIWIYTLVRKQYSYFSDRNMLFVEPTFLLGCLNKLKTWADVFQFTHEVYWMFKGRDVLGGLFIFTAPEVVITDLDVIQDVLVNDFKSFQNHPIYMNGKVDPLSTHLYGMCGEQWRNMRTKLSHAFSVSSIKAIFDTASQVTEDLVQRVDHFSSQGKPFCAKDLSMRYICDSVGSCAFGMNCRAMMDEDPILLKIAARLFQPKKRELYSYMAACAYPKVADYIPWVRTPKEVEHYFMGIIKETVQYREENNIVRNDFMDILIQMKNNGCLVDDESGEFIGSLSGDELIAQAFLFFFLTYHNCRVMLTFAIYELSSNQGIQDRAREEIFRVLGSVDQENGAELTYSKLEAMTYLQQIADETLRKYPPTGFLERVANEDYFVKKGSGHLIEKGTMVMIPVMGIQNDPEFYPEPNLFNPDRMTKEQMRARHPAAFLPLGGGPRLCPGQRFAYLQVKLALVKLLSQYRLTLNAGTLQPRRTNNYLREFSVDDDLWIDAHRL